MALLSAPTTRWLELLVTSGPWPSLAGAPGLLSPPCGSPVGVQQTASQAGWGSHSFIWVQQACLVCDLRSAVKLLAWKHPCPDVPCRGLQGPCRSRDSSR